MMLRVVLLGKTGAGKSSLGNTLLGRDAFQIQRGMTSGTETCQWVEEQRNGLQLQVVDTPGLCDTHRFEEDVLREVAKSVALAAPGPHIIIMVLRCDKRFTEEEYEAYLTLKGLFGDGVSDYMIVVFSGADAYGDTLEEQRQNVKRESANFPPNLQKIIRDADGRFLPVNNKASRQDRDHQAKELVAAMNGLVEGNGGRYFISELTEEIDKLKQHLVQQRKSQRNCTLEEAYKETNIAIVQNTENPDFLEKFTRAIRNALSKFVAFVHRGSADGRQRTSGCSVM